MARIIFAGEYYSSQSREAQTLAGSDQLRFIVFSFGFKYGDPVDVNMILDVRFLPNPYWVGELRHKTGKERDVADYVLQSRAGESFLGHLLPLLGFLVEQNEVAGKETIRLAIGCTGGRHRSVAIAERIADYLASLPVALTVFHRDIDKDGGSKD